MIPPVAADNKMWLVKEAQTPGTTNSSGMEWKEKVGAS